MSAGASVMCVLVTALVSQAQGRLLSQVSNAPIVDHAVAIGVFLHGRANLYAPAAPGFPVFYSGEDVRVEVVVANQTDVEIAVGEAGRSWIDDLQLTVVRQHAEGTPSPMRVSTLARFARTGRLTLLPGHSTNDVFTLRADTGQPLPIGMYTIAVELPTLERVGKGTRITRRRVSFEVREPVARGDVLDYYLHQAYRARIENRPKDERIWIDRVMAMHPGSLAAWLDLAELTFRQGDCKAAIAALTRALSVLTSKADQELRVRPPAEHEFVLRQRLQKCGATA
jgi:hypothetical protein